MRYHGFPNSIVTNRGFFFTSKLWLLLYYFLGIKRRFFTTFHLQTDGQTERQNSIMESYLRAFVNFEQNDWAQLLFMAEFTYNNATNASIGHTLFNSNCGYHPCVFYKEDLDPRSKSKTVEELSFILRNLMAVCQQNLYHAQKF